MSTTIDQDTAHAYQSGRAEGMIQGFVFGFLTTLSLAGIAYALRWLLA
jgi:hypothetical protein